MVMQNQPKSAKTIGGSWQPSEDALRQLAQLGVTKEFAQQQIPQFVSYWRDRNVPRIVGNQNTSKKYGGSGNKLRQLKIERAKKSQ